MTNLAVETLAFDGASSSTIYAGTGEFTMLAIRGAGIFKSTDAGTTWNPLAGTPSSWRFISHLATVPGQAGLVFAAADSGIWRSTDYGSNWTAVQSVSGWGMTVIVDPNNTQKVVAVNLVFDGGTSYHYQILYSTNGGVSFTASTQPALNNINSGIDIAYANASPNVVYAHVGQYNQSSGLTSGQVWKSTDGGASFTNVSGANNISDCSSPRCTIWVDPTDSNFLVLGGSGLNTSTNGGASSVLVGAPTYQGYNNDPVSGDLHADLHAVIPATNYSAVNRTVYICTDGGIYRTSDIKNAGIGNGSWTSLNATYETTQFYSTVAYPDFPSRFVGGTQDNGTLYTSQSSEPIVQNTGCSQPPPGTRPGINAGVMFCGDGGYVAVNRIDRNLVYGEYIYMYLTRSTDGGRTASYFPTFPPDAGSSLTTNFFAPFALDPNVQTTMLVGGASVWRSPNITDPSPTWTAIRPPTGTSLVTAIAIAPSSSDVVWVGLWDNSLATISKTTSGTASLPIWGTSGVGTLPSDRPPTRILVDPDDSNIVYVTFGFYNFNNVWRTTDGGSTWQSVSAGLNVAVPVRAIVRHPRNRNVIYVGTEVGFFESTDGGSTWSASQEGPSDAPVYDLSLVLGTDLLVLASHGRGLWTADTSSVTSYAPTNLVVNKLIVGQTVSEIDLTWSSYSGASSYEIVRSTGGGVWTTISGVATNSYQDTNVTQNVTYVYRVRAVVGGIKTGLSAPDFATTVVFTDPALQGLAIQAAHLQQLRDAVNLVLSAAHLTTQTFGTLTPQVTQVQAADITDLRTAIVRAYRGIGMADPTFAEPINQGLTIVKASHYQELRMLVR